jgi:integrase
MARKVRSSPLETRTARLKLAIRKRPYWVRLNNEGLSLGYRRNQAGGTWSMRVADGRGSRWIKAIAPADDYEGTAGALDYWAAQRRAVELHRGGAADDHGKLQTVAEAVEAYARDLATRGGGATNASVIRFHMTPSLGTKLVASLNARELRHWRDSLLDKGLAPASVTRVCKALAAAFSLAAAHDPRIQNRDAWRVGLASLPDSGTARNVILSDDQVRKFVAAAYEVGPALGLLVELSAITGARPSQLRRLTVGDVQRNRLMMPSSLKGKGKRRVERRPVPIPEALALRLKQAGKGRTSDAPLLLKDSGEPWQKTNHADPVRAAVQAAGLDPDKVTLYALRHSSIVRQLLKGLPIRVVGDAHDTSVAMIEKTYSKHIAHHADELVRSALIELAVPVAGNVVPLR